LAGKYHLLRKLGAGGMAEVFLAKQLGLDGFEKLVVIKRILPHLAMDEEFVTMFLDEARTAADLRHPNVVNIMEVNQADGTYYMAMEFLHGQDIRRIQRKAAKAKTPIPFAHCIQIIIDAANGLNYAHTKTTLDGNPLGLVHRDVSPQNVLVTYDGATKIVDFGIAKAATQDSKTATGVIKGKYTYMSPEQAQGENIDHRSDQFALGIVFWELLTMRRLFKRAGEIQTLNAIIECDVPKPSTFVPDIPQHLEHVVLQMLQPNADDRFDTCQDVALELEEVCAEASIVHSPARLGKYMRESFHDEVEHESELTEGTLDGDSFSMSGAIPGTHPDRQGATKASRASKQADPVDVPEDAGVSAPDAKTTASRSSPVAPAASIADAPDVEPATSATGNIKPPAGMDVLDEGFRDYGSTQTVTDTEPNTDSTRAFQTAQPTSKLPLVAGLTVGLLLAVAAILTAVVFAGGDATNGVLTVRTTPRGASVFVDGQDTGKRTPAVIRKLGTDRVHDLRVTLAGYGQEVATFRFADPPVVELEFKLTKQQAKVTGQMGKVEPVGTTAPPVTDPPAQDPPKTDPAATDPQTDPAADKPKTRKTVKKKKPGTLRFIAKPWADVYVDGKKIGQTPMKPRKMPPGSYKVEFKNPELGKTKSFTIKLKSGGDEKVFADFR
jgi:serine/threonine protein kinase